MIDRLQQIARFLVDPRIDIEMFGMFGPGNLGDEAMLAAARQVLGETRLVPWQRQYHRPTLDRVLRARTHPDLLVGGGTLIHGGDPGWLEHVEQRAARGMRLSFVGTGMAFTPGQIRDRSDAFRRWAALLAPCERVFLRGPRSVALARSMGAEAEVFGDFALMLHDPALVVTDHAARQDRIGINIGETLGDQPAYERVMAGLLADLRGTARLVLHVVVDTDLPATRRVIAAAGLTPADYEIQKHYFDPLAFLRAVRADRAFIGLKMHAAGLAMVAGVPTLMLAYLPKAYDFMAPLGADGETAPEGLVLDLPLDPEALRAGLDRLLTRPETAVLTDRIAPLAARQRARLGALFTERARAAA